MPPPKVVFERYADDMIVHCRSQLEAERVMVAVTHTAESAKCSVLT